MGLLHQTRDELARHLDELGVNPANYHLFGAHVDDAFVLDRRPHGWVVFYSERGGEDILGIHSTGSAACADLFAHVTADEHVFFTLVAGPAPSARADAEFDRWLRDRGTTRDELVPRDWKTDDVPWVPGSRWRRYFVRTLTVRELQHRLT
ncbi:hypothetical protein N802_13655 [Knoellia sinensis KCTC 19936]|uniref:Uncharacterized protein n=1 Tax=Knoellia sinensis KCTC 19936 TaxID=1385520 RepID=A0A0A0J1D4_9MICO|nr:hypothetical protein N802_13655 [Knoellia sinensis KCTC 19936]